MSDLAAYQEAMKAAIGDAIDAGKFYNVDVEAFVTQHCRIPDPARERFLGTVDLPDEAVPAQKILAELAGRVAEGDRGTWALTKTTYSHNSRTVHRALFSDGSGKLSPGCRSDSFDAPPTYERVKQRIFEMEVYLARKDVEAARLKASNHEAITSGRVVAGAEFKDVTIGSDRYSKAKVTSVDEEAGKAAIELTKRGSRKRYTTTVGAAFLSPAPKAVPMDEAEIISSHSPGA